VGGVHGGIGIERGRERERERERGNEMKLGRKEECLEK